MEDNIGAGVDVDVDEQAAMTMIKATIKPIVRQ
jgi:hypothetical protein